MTKEQGLSLLDIAPASERVKIGDDQYVQVIGVSAKGILSIFQRFPEIFTWVKGGGKVDIPQLLNQTPGALAAVIAAGCGLPNNEAAEETATNLPIETQLDLLEAIGRLTFKNGFGPFAQRMIDLAAAAQSVNYGRAQDMRSRPQSKPASPPVTTAKPSGATLPAN